MWVPITDGLVLRGEGTWPDTAALYWPEAPEVIERIDLRACARRAQRSTFVAARSRGISLRS